MKLNRLNKYAFSGLGMDLGSEKIVIATAERIVYREPTLLAVAAGSNRVLFHGHPAAERALRPSGKEEFVKPVARGVIADYAAAGYLLKKALSSAGAKRFLKPAVIVSAPVTLNSVEERALCDAAREAGAGRIFLVPCNLATGISATSGIEDRQGGLIADIGAETANISAQALNRIVCGRTVKTGGTDITDSVASLLEPTGAGRNEAEKAKRLAGVDGEGYIQIIVPVKMENGMTELKEIDFPAEEIAACVRAALEPVFRGIVETLEETPPELYEDIYRRGLLLTGGSARIKGLAPYFEKRLHLKTSVLEEPELSVIRGLGKILAGFNQFKGFFREQSAF